jgi:hypothetical protein
MSGLEELRAMVATYNQSEYSGSFAEYATAYLQEHPSQYDFSTAIEYIVIERPQGLADVVEDKA